MSFLLNILTFLVELSVFSFLSRKKKDKKIPLVLFLVNLITRPVFALALWSVNNFNIINFSPNNPSVLYYLAFFEVFMIGADWILLCFALPYSRKELFWLSVLANLASFMAGILLISFTVSL
jgi:hypothetical protein